MLSKMMLEQANVLLFNDPTNHLDLESIQALNNGIKDYKGSVIFNSHDHEFINTIANRIIEIGPNGMLDKMMTFDEYIADEKKGTLSYFVCFFSFSYLQIKALLFDSFRKEGL